MLIKQAKEEDEKGNYEAAFRLYESGVEHFLVANKYEKNESARETVKKRVSEYMDRMVLLKDAIKDASSRATSPNPNGATLKSSRKDSKGGNSTGKLFALFTSHHHEWTLNGGVRRVPISNDGVRVCLAYLGSGDLFMVTRVW